jgi:hypothetical protein
MGRLIPWDHKASSLGDFVIVIGWPQSLNPGSEDGWVVYLGGDTRKLHLPS